MARRSNPALLKALRQKLAPPGQPPVSLQAVSERRRRIQSKVPMATDIATGVVAQRAGIPIHRFLDDETLNEVAKAEQRLSAKEASSPAAAPSAAKKTGTRASPRTIQLDRVKVPSTALSPERAAEAERMAAVYPLLYVFENSVREFVDGHLAAVHGKDWWNDPQIVSTAVRKTVERNKKAEEKHRYHSKRGARDIYYTNLGDLPTITNSENGWKVFRKLFPSDKWLSALVEKVETSRNVVSHMNPLKRRDIDRIRINLEDWLEQIKGHAPPSVP